LKHRRKWNYYSEITPDLFIGTCLQGLRNIKSLKKEIGFSAVLCLQTDADFAKNNINIDKLKKHYEENGIEFRHIPIIDHDSDDLRDSLPKCVETLAELLKEDHTVYLHCNSGINRSPTVAIAYFHAIENYNLSDAFSFVVNRHELSSPIISSIINAGL